MKTIYKALAAACIVIAAFLLNPNQTSNLNTTELLSLEMASAFGPDDSYCKKDKGDWCYIFGIVVHDCDETLKTADCFDDEENEVLEN